ncbi:metalloregulator ArsR/SmtB family transcription factor [Amycolatopsis sp. TNS106]|uniref:ArsR/SmtB family transcription factor n=1 Tax=Amycolatopsis sp. TNS106 TaxID=2861750 RepID=UPI001C58A1DA|nr:metalloregulator ArsR/SmtB family transcription factor [Amycolatopsis sp. TNS106]QXV56956.1 ArsR family transcriptional regulator [Amycolatopsis sp. TNS106]
MTGNARPKDAVFEQFARVGKALASPKRLELIDVLAQGERTVESLAQAASLKLTTASAHLQTLRQGGLVTSRKEGTRIFYRLAGEEVLEAFVAVRKVAAKQLAETDRAARDFLGEDGVEAVSRNDLLERVRTKRCLLIDVRPPSEFAAGHIEGAQSIPLDQLSDRLAELPAEMEIVAYCRGEYCVLSYDAVRLLRAKGRPARRLDGGMIEWRLEQRQISASAA